jgi:hypothetical protein
MLFGHIYKEFKEQYSYFDILKMLLKLFIIFILNRSICSYVRDSHYSLDNIFSPTVELLALFLL